MSEKYVVVVIRERELPASPQPEPGCQLAAWLVRLSCRAVVASCAARVRV